MLEKLISSKIKRELLKLFVQNPTKVFYQSEVRFNIQANSWAATQRALKDLVELGIIKTWDDKVHRYYQAKPETGAFRTISKLIKLSSTSTHLPKIGKGKGKEKGFGNKGVGNY